MNFHCNRQMQCDLIALFLELSDHPSYVPECFSCFLLRSSKGYMAQLMRIYIVTPDGPLKVSVNPLIQPAPNPCPLFHPGTGGEIDLTPCAVWVMRLPYPFN